MMGGWVVLSKIASPAFISWFPENFELALLHSILKPIKAHINGLAPALLEYSIGSACWQRCYLLSQARVAGGALALRMQLAMGVGL